MKVKYNKVFGYYLEVTNSYKDMVPDYYITQTDPDKCGALYHTGAEGAGGERSLDAEDKLTALEYDLYVRGARDQIADEILRIQKTAHAIAGVDVFASLALVAERETIM